MRIVVVLLLVVTACSGSAGDLEDPQPRGLEVPLITALAANTGGDAALGTFVLEHDVEQNCLYSIEEDNNGEPGTGGRVVIMWPFGYAAEVTGETVTVFDADGEAVAVTGRRFQIGGGGGPVAGREHPALCGAIGIWFASSAPLG